MFHRRLGHIELGFQRHPVELQLVSFRIGEEVLVLGPQGQAAFLVVAGLLQQGFDPLDLRLADQQHRRFLIHIRLVDSFIDLCQQVLRLHLLVELDGQVDDGPGDEGPHLNGQHRLDLPRGVDHGQDVAAHDLIRPPLRPVSLLPVLHRRPVGRRADTAEDEQDHE